MKLSMAVRNHYWYQFYLDDLPMWGMVGEMSKSGAESQATAAPLVFTHKKFSIAYNGNRLIQVNLTSSEPQAAVPQTPISFTYEVHWQPTHISFEQRFSRYLDHGFFEHDIHWFSIFNSFMMVIFLCGLVALILLRTLRNDYARYTQDEDDLDFEAHDNGRTDESGWKQVHADVFRRPRFLMLFAALLGTGWQLIVLVVLVIAYAFTEPYYDDRGAVTTAFIGCYAVSSLVAGYKSGAYYHQYFFPRPSANWVKTMLLTALVFPSFCFTVGFALNTIAVYYGTMLAIPIGTVIKVLLIWVLVSLPLTVVGTIFGRHWSGKPNFPCRVSRLLRPIPPAKWYTKTPFLVSVAGVLPFGSIFIETYFVFSSFWNYKFYYVYGFMLLVYAILTMVTFCVAIVVTYFLLNAEDWRWQWMAFVSSGSSAGYVFCYSIYYFFARTNMTGFLQTCFYFGYMAIFCFGLFILCGTLGTASSTAFVRRIYRNIKCD